MKRNCIHHFVSDGAGYTCIGCGKKYIDATFLYRERYREKGQKKKNNK